MGVHPDMLRDAADNDHGVIDMLTYWVTARQHSWGQRNSGTVDGGQYPAAFGTRSG